jgi:predicted ArsR family transcriptional regulator
MNARTETIYAARRLDESGKRDDAILLLLRELGEATSADLRVRLGVELTEIRKIAGRLRSLERRGLVEQRFTAFTDTNYWMAVVG